MGDGERREEGGFPFEEHPDCRVKVGSEVRDSDCGGSQGPLGRDRQETR